MLWLEILNTGKGTHEKAHYKISVKATGKYKVNVLHETEIGGHDRDNGWVELLKNIVFLIEDEKRKVSDE